tara:strand:+ start:433 stop:696 length:264 start_codon:yes stop_codon:yes gene_type:complete
MTSLCFSAIYKLDLNERKSYFSISNFFFVSLLNFIAWPIDPINKADIKNIFFRFLLSALLFIKKKSLWIAILYLLLTEGRVYLLRMF